jgi:hypothetical protein
MSAEAPLSVKPMTNIGHVLVVSLVAVAVLTRVVWFADFFRRCWKASAGCSTQWRQTRERLLRTTNQLQGGAPERHNVLLQQESRRLETMLVGGSVALAAWTQLFVSSEEGPASRLSELSLGLLFSGAFCLIAGALFWRAEGLHLTLMGRTAALHMGFNLIVLSLTSVVLDLRTTAAVAVPVLSVALLIGLREVTEVLVWVRKIHALLRY